jgi:phage replication O-like protein O
MTKQANLSVTQTNAAGVGDALGISSNDPVNLYAMRAKLKTKNEFVMMFYENFARLVELLTKRELRVLMAILRFLEYQNVFKITQKTLADFLQVDVANVSRAVKTLRAKKIISIDVNGTEYVNPYIFAKGNMLEIKRNSAEISQFFVGQSLELQENNQSIIQKPF